MPSWWDDLSVKLGIQLDGVPVHDEVSAKVPAVSWEAKKPETPSILLCGMRGSGKSFSGQVAASTLGWPLIDTICTFRKKYDCTIRDFISKMIGRASEKRNVVLEEILKQFPSRHVISLGGDGNRPSLGESIEQIWARRATLVPTLLELGIFQPRSPYWLTMRSSQKSDKPNEPCDNSSALSLALTQIMFR
ncbi:hypothetical protein H4Q26_005507 [Puccinia striiformis f. sp. tritici PST-130]|nr:hypothetical protein H4Q26_005507 [Puccinia striiformis f. sp. tritici PST-130]